MILIWVNRMIRIKKVVRIKQKKNPVFFYLNVAENMFIGSEGKFDY